MVNKIVAILGDEILDSRGYPTLRVEVRLQSGISAFASVPSGASTGEGEAHELRDGDSKRYAGRGVLKAIANLAEVGRVLRGHDPTKQSEIDRLLIEADGTETKSRLGANAIVGTSMAVARAGAQASGRSLYAYLAAVSNYRLPVPMMNVINGGVHAANSLDFQEFMIVPHGAPSFREGLRWGVETYHALRALLNEKCFAVGVGDEGGFAPDLGSNDAACVLIVEAIERAGFIPGEQIALALDPAASSFWRDGSYDLSKSGAGTMESSALQALYTDWTRRFPIISIEDGFGEHDWAAFQAQSAEIGKFIQIVGDDLYVTNTNAVLIKLNQIGTVTETIAAIAACRAAGWNYIISHRSGETDDPFIADFAVAMNGGQIKAGAPCRGERLAKYTVIAFLRLSVKSLVRASTRRLSRAASPRRKRAATPPPHLPHRVGLSSRLSRKRHRPGDALPSRNAPHSSLAHYRYRRFISAWIRPNLSRRPKKSTSKKCASSKREPPRKGFVKPAMSTKAGWRFPEPGSNGWSMSAMSPPR